MSNEGLNGCFNLLLVGVGGQGVLTAARMIGEAAVAEGHEVRIGQLHGMSQRGGSVESTVIIGPGQTSFIGRAQTNVVLGLEPLETERALPRMSQHTQVVLNRGHVTPYILTHQGKDYPTLESILEKFRAVTDHVIQVDGTALAHEAGDARVLNVVMLGALVGLDLLPFGSGALLAGVEKRTASRFLKVNRLAFEFGQRSVTRGSSRG